jgi:hypothetical protein
MPPLVLLFSHEETGISSVGAYAEGNRAQASRAIPVISRALAVSIDARVDAAAVEVNADPGTAAKRARPLRGTCRVLNPFDIQVKWGWLVHYGLYRP